MLLSIVRGQRLPNYLMFFLKFLQLPIASCVLHTKHVCQQEAKRTRPSQR